jgi:DNA-binding MarR family transcriptional regulator
MTSPHEYRFGFLVTDVGRLAGKLFDQRAKHVLSLTRAQCRVLASLAWNDGINQANLADLLEVSPIALARLLDRMAEAGWIERQPNPADRRAHRLRLTPKAEATLDDARRVGDGVQQEALAGFSPQEGAALIEMLQRVRLNLTATLSVGTDSPDKLRA